MHALGSDEREAVELAHLEHIIEYLDEHNLKYKVWRYGSFDYIELVIHHPALTLKVSTFPYISFTDLSGTDYIIDECMIPESFASVTHRSDGSLLLNFDPPS